VRTKELILDDGQEYDQFYDPFKLSARNILRDLNEHANAPLAAESIESLKIQL